jgi:uncharacterized membrane protein YkoI
MCSSRLPFSGGGAMPEISPNEPRKRNMKRALLSALLIAVASAPAFAQSDDMAPARLQRLDEQAKARGLHLNHAQAIEIARANGVVSVREVDLEKNDEWKVEGRDAEGREIEVELSAHDGKVRKVERD